MRYFLVLIMVAATTVFPLRLVFAQEAMEYPSRPVRIIVAVAPGGALDAQARLFAQKLSENLKRQFVVENHAGAGGTIGFGLVAKSAPDGYTLLAVSPGFTNTPALYPKYPYDPAVDFAPVSLINKAPYLMLVHPALPVRSPKELIGLARSKPGALNIGVGQSGSFTHLAVAYFVSAAGIKATIIPYKGNSQVTTDTMAGHIQMFFGNVLGTLPHVKTGRLKALGVSSAERSSALPDLPTISESGLPGYEVTSWHGWVAPAGLPAAIATKLSMELSKAVRSPDVVKLLAGDGGEPVGSTPEQFRQTIATEVPRWRKVVKDSGMRVE